MNDLLTYKLKKYIPRPGMTDLYKITLSESWYDQTNHLQNDQKQLQQQIKELKGKLYYIRDLLSSMQIEPADFRDMKTEYSGKLENLEHKLSIYDHDQVNIDALLDKRAEHPFKTELCV